jgi:ParB family chromosome partitioning protein
MPIPLNVPLAIQSPLTNPTIQSIERSTGNIPVATQTISGTAVVEISISFIARNSRQPREKFDDRAIQSLAESIRQHGLLQPVVIRKLRIPHGGKTHELIAGERRLRAFESLERITIPSITRDADEAQSAVFALIENVQREDLNPLERSKALQRLITEFSWTQQQAAEKVGLDRATVANLLRLNDLDPFSAGCVREGRLSQGHAKALLAIDNLPARRAIAEKALHDEWSVRQIEREVQRVRAASGLTSAQVPPPPRRGSAQVGDLERRVGLHIGSKVKIKKGRKAGTGTLTIQFFTLDQFDGILQKMGFDPNNLNY